MQEANSQLSVSPNFVNNWTRAAGFSDIVEFGRSPYLQGIDQELLNRYCYVNGLEQERCNSSALAMELRLSCTNPWMDGLVQERCNSSALALELRLSRTNPLM